jgi:hypothetical protein
MARSHRTFRVVPLLLAACAAPAPRPEPDPIRPEDLAALPAAITRENAADVARKCLQRHAAASASAWRRVGYRFTTEGVERIVFETFHDGRRDRWDVDVLRYAELPPPRTETRLDPTRLRRVTDVIAGPWTFGFDDADTALALARALETLRVNAGASPQR